jgi:hypothetical protein
MAGNTNKTVSPDRNRINLSKRYEVDLWCTRFGCTEGQLCAAVAKAGTDPAMVRTYFDVRRQQDEAMVAHARIATAVRT